MKTWQAAIQEKKPRGILYRRFPNNTFIDGDEMIPIHTPWVRVDALKDINLNSLAAIKAALPFRCSSCNHSASMSMDSHHLHCEYCGQHYPHLFKQPWFTFLVTGDATHVENLELWESIWEGVY